MMTSVVWDELAIDAAAGFLKDASEALAQLIQRIDHLGRDPRPAESSRLGDGELYRLRVGRYRAVYEIHAADNVVTVFHIGRTG